MKSVQSALIGDKNKIDRTEYVPVDTNILPPDAEFKGYRSVIKQNIKFETDNVEHILECYHAPRKNKIYGEEIPEAVQSFELGSDLKAFIANPYYTEEFPKT
ncbi:MAG: hypothetical protein U9Q68_07375 [Euryarchaeota archaeon]|nr:hypothetical protein [Euryarchaeota archaeon]